VIAVEAHAVDWSVGPMLVLTLAGVLAGFINAVAGGGSLLTVPALALVGLPWDVANGSNRVGVLVQGLVATRRFSVHGRLPIRRSMPLLGVAIIGTIGGALLATVVSPKLLEPLIIGMLVVVGLMMTFRPRLVLVGAGEGEPHGLRERPSAAVWLILVGFYGGFLQAGVGYFLLAVAGGVLRYDIIAANGIKVLVVAGFTLVALPIFILDDLVAWPPALVLAAASGIGSVLGVRFAVRTSPRVMRWLILTTLVATCIAVILR
jgi:uncharacterized membrane protein YfcA